MATITIKIKGTSPMLMHNPAGMMHGGQGDKITEKVIPTPEDEARASLYVDPVIGDHRHLYVPSVAVRNCIVNGAKGHSVKYLGRRISATGIVAAALSLTEEKCPLYSDGRLLTPEPQDYEIDIRRAVLPAGHVGIIRARARIALPWDLTATFGFDEGALNPEELRPIIERAGKVVGLLDYRPEKKGWFGRFELVEMRLEK